jgi:hypothetical protein
MAKTGKDREGNYHPPKGKPSGEGASQDTNAKIGVGIYNNVDIEDPADLPGDVHVRHPNRNTEKKEVRSNKKDAAKKETTAVRKGGLASIERDASSTNPATEIDMNTESFRELANHDAQTCISIFIATHAGGNEKMDATAFKSALQKVTSQLQEKGLEATQIKELLAPAHALLQEDNFWNNQQQGLAVFIAEGFCRYARMPITPAEFILCNKAFYLSPLIPWVVARDKFYLLVLSKKRAQIFRGDAFGLQPISIPELPDGIEDVVHLEEKDDQTLFRTGSSGAGKGANYHGIGGGKPDEKQNVQMYLEEVDRTLWTELLNRENCPVLLAGVNYLLPLFKQSTQYKHIWPDVLTGSFEHADVVSLYKASREVLEPYFAERLNQALVKFQNKSATELTSSIPEDIIPSAHYGKISILFVKKGYQLWGTFDEQSNQLSIHAEAGGENEPLVDQAVVKTLMNGGEVFEAEASQLPEGADMAALMRY